MTLDNKDLINIQNRVNKLKPTINSSYRFKNHKVDPLGIGIEIVAGVLVGLICGIFLDKIFTTKPIFLIICLMLGIIASGRTIWQKINYKKNA